MKIVFVGDSITGWSDLSKYLKFSHIIECMVEAKFGPGRHTVLNRGKGGDSTDTLLARLEADVIEAQPEITVLLISGNDAGKRMSREVTSVNLDLIVSRIKAVCPRVLMLQYHMVPWSTHPGEAWGHLDDNNDLIAEAARKHECPLLDMGPIMLAARDDGVAAEEKDFRKLSTWSGANRYRTSDLVGVDGVHLMFGGELVYARAIFAKLLELQWLDGAGRS